MNTGLHQLHRYPFEKLAQLLEGATSQTKKPLINLAIGEPKHKTPQFILDKLTQTAETVAIYPTTRGTTQLRESIAAWLVRRFSLPHATIDPEQHVLPVSGTREALFAIAQTVIAPAQEPPVVIMPNPFYQIYEGAALLAGAVPYYLNYHAAADFMPDFSTVPKAIWQRCQLFYLCSPHNPTGRVLDAAAMTQLLDLAEQYDFIIAADECYSEIYLDESSPPIGLLECAKQMGNTKYQRCLVFHSLSKRSNAPGLRSGFVAGDSRLIADFLRYRSYHGCTMPLPIQQASTVAWQEEQHVVDNRKQYREKFTEVCQILGQVVTVSAPPASFYLWVKLPSCDSAFAKALYESEHIKVLPGTYLSRQHQAINPGANHVRIALVAPLAECVEAANRMAAFINSQNDLN